MKDNFIKLSAIIVLVLICSACRVQKNSKLGMIKLLTFNPGHFHAALVQKIMFDKVSKEVNVYAPDGAELATHLKLINSYNTRENNPTNWQLKIYKGEDYLQKMLDEKKGNVVILAGNNQKKTTYINEAVQAGLNVLADKPMAIDKGGFEILEKAFQKADAHDLLLFDIMTERYEITNLLQKELAQNKDIFGTIEKGSLKQPAVEKLSVHHFFKYVSGAPLIRPAWYFDVEQEGEGLVDVTTHLVDLIQWSVFPETVFDYKNDVEILSAQKWSTPLSLAEFTMSTRLDTFPDYLKKDLKNGVLQVNANGEMIYTLKGVHVKVGVKWDFEAPKGSGDTHYSLMRGTKAHLLIKQGKEQNFKPILYIKPLKQTAAYTKQLNQNIKKLSLKYPGIALKPSDEGWEIIIPEKYHVGHEAHFAEVAKKYFSYLKKGELPAWEKSYMLTKYYTTTSALSKASLK
ncbi:oxidoreductase [Pedobacter aquae]|uniref:Oxidoreductase n=2 Tax=Pedobacter aquae TaxID=2605747 RepID=A0A5C0VFN9_9SPHI|nr:oxidoreductase [Pedobacter aquae]